MARERRARHTEQSDSGMTAASFSNRSGVRHFALHRAGVSACHGGAGVWEVHDTLALSAHRGTGLRPHTGTLPLIEDCRHHGHHLHGNGICDLEVGGAEGW